MFVALKDQRTGAGERKKGAQIPEAAGWDLASIRNLVNAGAIEWRGDGGKYGPHTTAIVAAAELERAGAPAARDPDNESPVTRDELDAFMARVVETVSALNARLDRAEVSLGSIVHGTNLGSASAPKPDPSPNKGGR